MKNTLFAGLLAAAFSAALLAAPAEAGKRHARHHARASAAHGNVVAMIKSMAPAYGVPTWFALKIAKVESGYNPRARGAHGELGVFQMKCSTAHGIGYRGSCAGLLDARTGVDVGLKHLSLAIRASGGNLKLAASKHNGGLGRKRLVPRYVAQVF
jgi:soluble lytic murein transglycosylase-like protein